MAVTSSMNFRSSDGNVENSRTMLFDSSETDWAGAGVAISDLFRLLHEPVMPEFVRCAGPLASKCSGSLFECPVQPARFSPFSPVYSALLRCRFRRDPVPLLVALPCRQSRRGAQRVQSGWQT